MFINPTVAINEGWITGNITDDNIQPNAIDFTLDRLFTIWEENIFRIDEDSKDMRGGVEVHANEDPRYQKNYWRLSPHTSYDGMSNFFVKVPEGVACMMIIRSTFNRNGIFITSGLYDSGYEGHVGFAVHNNSGIALVAPGTRIGQLIFVESDHAKLYAGGYNHEEGTHHSEAKSKSPYDLSSDKQPTNKQRLDTY